MNQLRFGMWIPLSSSVVVSNMVVYLLAFVAPSVIMSISILLSCISLYGCTFTSSIFLSFASFYVVACPSIDCYSTPSFSFDFWMYIGHQHEQQKQNSTIIQNLNHQLSNGLFLSVMPCEPQKLCNLPTPLTITLYIFTKVNYSWLIRN
jgi:hypothetical protein